MHTKSTLMLSAILVSGCMGSPPYAGGGGKEGERSGPAKPQPPPKPSTSAPHFVAAPKGKVAQTVAQARAEAQAQGEQLLVYVGASWCEPCQRFHKAVEAGELDDALPGVKFLEFDADDDGERLADAKYDGRLIPRFAVPDDNGVFSGLKIEGGVKGDGAVDNIMQRLKPLLAQMAKQG